MQGSGLTRKQVAIILISLFVGLIIVISIIALFFKSDENQFGKFIPIQNYSEKVKNTPNSVKDATESYLYNVVIKNVDDVDGVSKISDAYIRKGSDSQQLIENVYEGTYIIDMESIKQSYRVEYLYSSDETRMGGNPIVVSCLPKEELIYGEFDCKDIVSEQATEDDVIMRYLPYENFSFKITPDATRGDTLTLVVKLDIPQSDLKGNAASRAEVVAMYKKEVTDWIISKGVDQTKYIIEYNYDDAGNLIVPEEVVGD